jgi:phage tail tape-measure protein
MTMNDTIDDVKVRTGLDETERDLREDGRALLETVAGAVVGAAAGAVAGPVGMAVGAAIGSVAAGVTGAIAHEEAQEARDHDAQLDKDIGVDGGDIGEASPTAPPARRGVFSASSMGVGGGGDGGHPAEGPIQNASD